MIFRIAGARKAISFNGVRSAVFICFVLALATCGGTVRKVPLDPESERFYRTARLIMTREESATFSRIPDAESRKEFIKDFWCKRDRDPDTEANEFKKEFDRRIDYTVIHFKEGGPGWNTDRGRIYIYMGPPEETDESFTHGDPEVRGAILWWIYDAYDLGVEFVDEKGYGQFKIRRYTGDFFEAMDILKLGQVIEKDAVFKIKVVKFGLKYQVAKKEFLISLPADALNFAEEGEKLKVDLDFIFFIYPKEGAGKMRFEQSRTFLTTNNELLDMKTISFTFPYDLPSGTHYVDVIIKGGEGSAGKIRKIFEVKIK